MSAASGEGIALVTVTHDSEHDLGELLASVSRHLPAAHVVVVDSGSHDGSIGCAKSWSGHATVLDQGDNVGFGRATNAGVAAVDEPVTVVLNPDVELLDDSLSALAAEVMRRDRAERILAPLVLRSDGTREDSAQLEPGAAALTLTALMPSAALPSALRRQVDPWRADRPRRVGWAVGCCLAARTDTLRRLGPFDARIFMYGEDLELGLRASDHGVETWFWPTARVLHKGAHSTRAAFGGEAFELLARQRRDVVARRRGPRRQRVDDLQQLATFANRVGLKRLLRRPAERERLQLAALRSARRDG